MYHPFVNSATASLDYLDSEELKDLLNDDDKLEERIVESVSILEKEKEEMLIQNRSIAEENLEKEPALNEVRDRIIDLTEQGKDIATKVQEKLDEIKTKSGGMTQETALALLQTAGAEMEEESDQLVKQLLGNDITIDEFLEQFMQTRKTMHLRKLKAEKMTDLMRNPNAYQSGGSGPGYPPASGFYPSTGAPYPIGMMPMPMMPNMYRPY